MASSVPINCTFFNSSGTDLRIVVRGWAQPHWTSFAEDRGANADERGAFFDRYSEVAGHTHRQMRQSQVEPSLELVAKLSKGDKISARRLSLGRERRNRHKAFDRESPQFEQRIDFRAERVGSEPDLTPLARYVNLQQDAWTASIFFRYSIDITRKTQRIHTMK